jgi:hypothetical protein
MLESKAQSRISRLGGEMMSDKVVHKSPIAVFFDKMQQWMLPVSLTMLCGTFTYPIAVRIARKVFRLKGFYAIHLSIAPFLGLVHTSIFGVLHSYSRIKIIERDFELYFGDVSDNVAMQQFMQGRSDHFSPFDYVHAGYYKLKDEVCRHQGDICAY